MVRDLKILERDGALRIIPKYTGKSTRLLASVEDVFTVLPRADLERKRVRAEARLRKMLEYTRTRPGGVHPGVFCRHRAGNEGGAAVISSWMFDTPQSAAIAFGELGPACLIVVLANRGGKCACYAVHRRIGGARQK